MVQLLRWILCFNVSCGEHDRVSDLVSRWGYASIVGVFGHSFSGGFQRYFAIFECSFDPVRISVSGGVHHFRSLRVECFRVPSIIGIEVGHPGG